MHAWQTITAVVVACLTALSLPASAQERAEEEQRPLPSAELEQGESAGTSAADVDLFQKLIGGADGKPEAEDNPLERAIRGMREARQQIGAGNAGAETRRLQQDVVANLEKLIEQLKRQSQSHRASTSPPKRQEEQVSPRDKESQQAQPSESQPSNSGKTGDDKSPESSDDPREAEDQIAAPVTREVMVREVWGHLPPALRRRLLNINEDKYLPKYDDLLRRYFQSLAEEGRAAEPTE